MYRIRWSYLHAFTYLVNFNQLLSSAHSTLLYSTLRHSINWLIDHRSQSVGFEDPLKPEHSQTPNFPLLPIEFYPRKTVHTTPDCDKRAREWVLFLWLGVSRSFCLSSFLPFWGFVCRCWRLGETIDCTPDSVQMECDCGCGATREGFAICGWEYFKNKRMIYCTVDN